MADWSATRRYYESDHWQRLSHAVRCRDNWRCMDCGFRAVRSWDRRRMQAHHVVSRPHLPYPTNMDVPDNLVTLCNGCHGARHQREPARRSVVTINPVLSPRGPSRPRQPRRVGLVRRVT